MKISKITIRLLLSLLFIVACTKNSSNNSNPPPAPDVTPPPSANERINSVANENKPIVIMISIDGFRADYLDKYSPPTLNLLAQQGVRAIGLIPSFPSLTFPNHVTLVSGRAPGHHGIVANNFYDEKRKQAYQMGDLKAVNDGSWYEAEPLWAVAEKSKMLSASYFWVGSEAKIGGIDPTYFLKYDGSIANSSRSDKVIEWLKLDSAHRPHMINLYFSDVDTAGHKFGPDSKEVEKAILDIDAAIKKLVDYADSTKLAIQFVVVSDHGMYPIQNVVELTELMDMKDWTLMDRGAMALLYTDKKDLVEPTYQALKLKENKFKVYRREDLPSEWQYTFKDRTADLVLLGEPGTYLKKTEKFAKEAPAQKMNAATHGWSPEFPAMHGLFIARGSMIVSGKTIEPFKNTNVYPFVLQLLGLSATMENEGNPTVLADLQKKK